MQLSTAQSPQSAESLDAVLGRFQAWSNSCKTDSRKPKDMTDGIRELSYEDALQSSRYRWQARAEAPGIEASGKVEPVLEPVEETPAHAAPVSQTPKVEVLSGDIYEEAALAPDTVSLSTIAQPSALTAKEEKKSISPPVFRTALAEAVSPVTNSGPLALVWPVAGKPERQVSMSLRVPASEQALIKVRAAEAGLPASAYLRQCALEVEQLRVQVQHTLAIMERNSRFALSAGEAPVQASSPNSSPGFLERMRRRIFGGGTDQLTLRA